MAVGLPAGQDLCSGGRDLDNYLFPIVRRIGASRFVAVFGEKRHGASLLGTQGADERGVENMSEWESATVLTTVAAQSKSWKEEVAAQLSEHSVVPDGGVDVHVSFRVSPRRNWATLWKPAIDSLGAIVGVEDSRRPFHPRDDRIVRLGLHCMSDSAIGDAVAMRIWWRRAIATEATRRATP